jgi:DNA-binding MarR family transcriptional regulator
LYGVANQSNAEQFDQLYGQLWRIFFKADAVDLSQHERQLLDHIPADTGIPLGDVARHLGIPKSSASEQVKSLERRGFLIRRRDPHDERRLSIVLTAEGIERSRGTSVLDLVRLAPALRKLTAGDRKALLAGLERLAAAAPKQSAEVVPRQQAHTHRPRDRYASG